jgi:hypothetical protein
MRKLDIANILNSIKELQELNGLAHHEHEINLDQSDDDGKDYQSKEQKET